MNSFPLDFDTAELGLFTDLYELTMMQAYFVAGMDRSATFSLYFRELPPTRNFMLACGQRHAARLATRLRFPPGALDELAKLDLFRDDFLRWLGDYRFSGDIVALPEGTPVFGYEPLLEVTAPIAEAQLLETLLMNQVHLETVLASKAARVVLAARGRPVVDFGMRRMHGVDAANRGVRAYRIAGIEGTSNVLGGPRYGAAVRGTMAHSFVQASGDEMAAFRTYAELYPGTTLLVDTHDTLAAVDKAIAMKAELGDRFNIGAIRLDSGDLAALARTARGRLDAAGMGDVRIVASGGLDEYKIEALVKADAPIDAFGVGTALGTSADAPNVDLAYKLTMYDDEPKLKTSPGKPIYPGRKQVWRFHDKAGHGTRDEITLRDESREATPLLEPVIAAGEPADEAPLDLDAAASHAREQVDVLPAPLRALESARQGFPVEFSDRAKKCRDGALARIREK
jgi:nicotinate phosphoribosyltransferase